MSQSLPSQAIGQSQEKGDLGQRKLNTNIVEAISFGGMKIRGAVTDGQIKVLLHKHPFTGLNQ